MAQLQQEFAAEPVDGDDDIDALKGMQGVDLGNDAFRCQLYDEAIKVYSEALQARPEDPAILLSNRCAAYCKLSERLRNIPAGLSEERALFGLDPMYIVQLALKDAEKLLKLRSDWPKAYLRKGTALVLSEQYEEARNIFLDGLQLDPTSKGLQTALHDLNEEFGGQMEEAANSRKQKRAKVERCDELDCTLCLKLLYSPITTPCGHSFCRTCLLQAMDHGNKCPMCRTVLFVSPKSYPVSVTLNNLIQRNFPEEYKERKAEMDEVSQTGEEMLPLFVMDVVLPSERMQLNIFEPRYRLMVRRVMEGNHRMGMVGLDETGLLADIGCEVEICECQPLPDGRFYLEVEGRRRFSITKAWEQDGYRVGQVKWIEDVVYEDGSSEKEQLNTLMKSASYLHKSWLQRGPEGTRSARRAFLKDGMPDATQAEAFSFWIANLLHIKAHERLRLMRCTDTRERLTREMQILRDAQGCHVQ